MNNLKAGFARVNITPMRGIPISGYFLERYAEGVLDELEAVALALESGKDRVLLIAADHLHVDNEVEKEIREKIFALTGVALDAIYIHSTHTHTAPYLLSSQVSKGKELVDEYKAFFVKRLTDVAVTALEDLKPAKMGYAVGQSPNIAFVRRFRMKDGSIRTNPGVNNPDIVEPIGEVDERVNVLRFTREGAEDIALINVGCHPDTVGGSKISADWPGFTRRLFEKGVENTRCIFFNGAQGDVNHVNVHPTKGDFNDMFMDFDDVSRGYGHARHMGRVVAGGAMQVWDKVTYVDVDSIAFAKRTVEIPSNMPKPEELPLAHKYCDLHNAGRDDEIPFKGMMLTTEVANARRIVRLENGPASFPMTFTALRVGNVAFFGIPGEPFNEIGRGVKSSKGWDMVLPTCLTGGSHGYFPVRNAYDEGGYEAKTSNFKAGVAELIIETGLDMLEKLR